jgi:dUTP pyrophosphatase
MLKINFKKNHPSATTPCYAKQGDAGMDLSAVDIISNEPFQIVYDTGIAVEIPEGYVGLVFPRSSIRKYDLSLTNSVGVIDSGYRGNIQVTFRKEKGVASKIYEIGDRVCQIMIVPYPQVTFVETYNLSVSERGEGGHGSTGISNRADVTYSKPENVTNTLGDENSAV